jgi:hypothetical protein
MKILVGVDFVSESASKKRCVENAKILFGSKGESIYGKLKDLEKTKELVLPELTKLMATIDKATADELNKVNTLKPVKDMAANVKRLVSVKSLDGLLKNARSLKVPKALCDIHDAAPGWGMKPTEKYTPNVEPASTHGDELRKLQYVKETKPNFTQHLKDGLMRGQDKLELVTKQEKIKDTANDGKMVPVTSFYMRKVGTKKTHLVGRWQSGGMGWHYDRLPQSLRKASVATKVK